MTKAQDRNRHSNVRRTVSRLRVAAVLASGLTALSLPNLAGADDLGETEPSESVRVVTYNIRHGLGSDNTTDLTRTAAVLESLGADIIGLQEVDRNIARSGGEDQAKSLGRTLDMTATFAAVMPLQGGEYGMAVLSRYPVRSVERLKLPEGNEPRMALVVGVTLQSGQPLRVVNVHFDWVEDDTFRYRQAAALHEHLAESDILPLTALHGTGTNGLKAALQVSRPFSDFVRILQPMPNPTIRNLKAGKIAFSVEIVLLQFWHLQPVQKPL